MCGRAWISLTPIFSLTIMFLLMASAVASPGEPVNAAALAKALRIYRDVSELSVKFKQIKTFKDISAPLHSEGELRIVRPDLVVWSFTRPSPLELRLTSEEIKITSVGDSGPTTRTFRRDQLTSTGDAKRLQALMVWLNLDPVALSKSHSIVRHPNGVYSFTPLTPGTDPFARLEMALNSRGELQHLIIYERSGDKLEFSFAKPNLKTKPQTS